MIYGTGGIGKTELCSLLGSVGVKPLFIDLEGGSASLNVARVEPTVTKWDELRSVLRSDTLNDFGAVVIDSLSVVEELAAKWTIDNVPHEKGHKVNSVEGYGFGKGFAHVYETFLQLLGDLDAQIRAGRHVVCIAHDCTEKVPNPTGEDWIRYEPRLANRGNGNIRAKVKEWSDHLLFIGYDTAVSKDGKASGSGTRTIYPCEMPAWLAASRCLSEPIVYERGNPELWNQLLKGGA